ncbi:hypothetical protein A3F45_03120, partial [Candidatus Curtissbacteria bacterium RIFCSPHIGHO2_12_FULL_41_17]
MPSYLTTDKNKWSNRIVNFSFLGEWVSHWRAYLAEFLGTFVFVLIASGAVLSNVFYSEIGTVGIALATGLSITSMMYATLHISGAHLNPAVTVALWLAQKIKGNLAFFYVISQILASFAAALVILLIFGSSSREFALGGPVLAESVSGQTGLVVEAILTAVLVFAVFATLVDRRGTVSFGPLVVGLVVTIASLVALPITGAAINPARAIGPEVLSGSYQALAIWIIGPLAGSLFGLVYD